MAEQPTVAHVPQSEVPTPVSTNDFVPTAHGAASPSGIRRGRFTIERLHAKGGLGQVNLACEARLNREVALKEIRPDRRNAEARRRFLIEAEITGQLEHPGIVPIYALDDDETGEPYYVMRFIQGEPLQEAIRRFHGQKPNADNADERREEKTPHSSSAQIRVICVSDFSGLEFRQLLQRFIGVCQTMAYAHSKGVIHRDLKPANVMLGDYGETLVVDWGLAKRVVRSQLPVVSGKDDDSFSREAQPSAAAADLPETQP